MSIVYLSYRLDVERIEPSSILAHIGFAGWDYQIMRESYLLALLIEHIVAIHILQGIDAISAWRHTLDDKSTTAIRAAHTQHRLGLES